MLYKILLGAVFAFCACYALARIAAPLTGVPGNFPPFTALPILSGAVAAPIGAACLYALVRHFCSTDPDRLFFFITLATFALSLGLPLRLSFTQSARFVGVTPSAQMILVVMHALVAASTFIALTYRTKGQ